MVATTLKEMAPRNEAPAAAHSGARKVSLPSGSEPEAVVCVPTFRRPEMLRRTLQSLVDQTTSIRFVVVVVDNDPADVRLTVEALKPTKLLLCSCAAYLLFRQGLLHYQQDFG